MILVTGANGFIGRSLMRALASEGREAHAFSGRITSPLAVRDQLEGVDMVIHLAGAETRGRLRALRTVDRLGTEVLVDACERAARPHLVFVSRLGADADSLFPLLQIKGEGERRIRQSDLPYTIVQTSTLFGKDDRFTNVIASIAGWTWPLALLPNGGTVAMQPLWVEDLVRCLLGVADRPGLIGQTIRVGGAERLRYVDIMRLVLDATGRRRWLVPVPLQLYRVAMRVAFFGWRRPPINRFVINRFSVPEVLALDAVPHLFGFRPSRMVDQVAYLRRPGLRRWLLRRV